jgi:hypothetical protein
MITKFKIFENKELDIRNLKIGDWLILTSWWSGQHLREFIDNTPCEVVKINDHNGDYSYVEVEVFYNENPMSIKN